MLLPTTFFIVGVHLSFGCGGRPDFRIGTQSVSLCSDVLRAPHEHKEQAR